MENTRKLVMELMNALEADYRAAKDERVKKAIKRALANLNRLFSVLLVVD